MSRLLDYRNEKLWELSYLKKKCRELGIEKDRTLYQIRLRIYYLSAFLILHWLAIFLHVSLLLTLSNPPDLIHVDVVIYFVAAASISAVMSINFNEERVISHRWIMSVSSIVSVFIIVGADLFISIFHYHMNDWLLGSFYDTYVILMIYMFFPITNILPPLGLGIVVSSMYIYYYFSYVSTKYRHEISTTSFHNKVAADISHHICLNILGVFFRVMRGITVRSSFLARHQYVMEDIGLRGARAKEKVFLHSILPEQIAQPLQDEIRNRIALAEKHHVVSIVGPNERIMSIQMHPDVTILYADIVNYTNLTTKLSVKDLVTILHELYARFDVAAAHFEVQRIKFLGDCYYCVSGLTTPDPEHAKYCVEFGQCMINHIRKVRNFHDIDIDMRIGIHSGFVFAGVLGMTKLQYDIWGLDVVIANRLESTGVTGHIHISERALQLIFEHSYTILPASQTAKEDPFLQKHNINTFLIPVPEDIDNGSDQDSDEDAASMNMYISKVNIVDDGINQELSNEFKQMPLGPTGLKNIGIVFSNRNQNESHEHSIRYLLLDFFDPFMESSYMKQPDYMWKYSVLMAWCICFSLFFIEIVYHPIAHGGRLLVSLIVLFAQSSILFISWYKKLCHWRFGDLPHRYSVFSYYIFRLVEDIQRNLIKRVVIYMCTIVMYFIIIAMILKDCDRESFEISHIESKLFLYEPDLNTCFHPWVITNIMCLIVGMTLIYTSIPFVMKVFVTLFEIIAYVVVVFFQFDYIFRNSLTTNPFFQTEYAHCILIIIATVSLLIMERQTEFNSKMNFIWWVELKKKQRDGRRADESISILLQNILPSHVVDIYLTSLARHELYYESYNLVSVMFATLQNFKMDLTNLRILNEVIYEFDKVLTYYKSEFLVEKIKIVGCTYMAACGLNISKSGSASYGRTPMGSLVDEVSRARRSLEAYNRSRHLETAEKEDTVFVLTTFALDLIRTLWICGHDYRAMPLDREMFNIDMSLGISCGQVMAGVVGASQVHYDIWGDAVNMASRMDSTGVAGKIQVTDESAIILCKCGIKCDYRGMTYVKGRGMLPTHFVGLDENLNFQYITNIVFGSESKSSLNDDFEIPESTN